MSVLGQGLLNLQYLTFPDHQVWVYLKGGQCHPAIKQGSVETTMGGDGEEMRVNRTHRAVRAPPKLSLHIPTVHTSLTSTDSFCFLWTCLSASSGCQNSLCSLRKKAGSIRRLTLLLCPAALQQQPRGSDIEVPYLSSSSRLTKSHVLHWRPEFPSRIKHQVFWGDLPNKLLVLKSLFRFCFCSSVWSTPLQLNSAPGKVVRNRWRFWLSVTETLGYSCKTHQNAQSHPILGNASKKLPAILPCPQTPLPVKGVRPWMSSKSHQSFKCSSLYCC